ncbi:MAG: ABC transporter substrate-binding protein [Bacillota bacterium]
MKKLLSAMLVVLILVFATSLVMAQDEEMINIGIGMDVKQLDPAFISDLPSERVAAQIHDRLLRQDAEGNIQPNLAEDWEVTDEEKVWTFYLKEGVEFTDGSEFNAEVVKWHFDRLKNPENATNYQDQFSIIEEIKVIDDYTVQFVLEQPYGPFIETILFSPGGLIPSKEHFEEVGADDYASNPVGTGPFEFSEWETGSHVELVRNEDYHRKQVKPAGLLFKPIPEPMTRIIELQTGGVDIVKSIPNENIEELEGDENVEVHTDKSGFYVLYVWFNLEDGSPFKDNLPLRRAIGYSIDKMELAQVLYGDYAIRCESYVPKASWAYSDDPDPIGFDMEKAREILLDAGYEYQDDQLYKDGEPVEIEYLSTTSERQWQTIAQYLQERLRKLGIKVDGEQMEWGTYLDNFTNRKYTLSSMGWSQNIGEPTLFLDVLVKTDGRGNFTGYSNPEVDEMLDQAAAVSSREERKEIYEQVYDILEEDLPMIPIHSQPLLEGVRKEVQNYIYSPYVDDYTETWIE